MKINIDDPRLIDYALGELNAEEHHEIEIALQDESNAEARSVVEEFRQVAQLSGEALRSEEVTTLNDDQRKAVLSQAASEGPSRAFERKMRPRRFFVPAFAMAAALVCGVGLVLWSVMQIDSSSERFEVASLTDGSSTIELSSEMMDQLEALGYLGESEKSVISPKTLSTSVPAKKEKPKRPVLGIELVGDSSSVAEQVENLGELDEDSNALSIWPATVENAKGVTGGGGAFGVDSRGGGRGGVADLDIDISTGTKPAQQGAVDGLEQESGSTPDVSLGFALKRVGLVEDQPSDDMTKEIVQADLGDEEGKKDAESLQFVGDQVLSAGRRGAETGRRVKTTASGYSAAAPPAPAPMPKPALRSYEARTRSNDETITVGFPFQERPAETREQLESLGYLSSSVTVESHKSELMPDPRIIRRRHEPYPHHNAEAYAPIVENDFLVVSQKPLSTFSVDVDTASYANVRRFINRGSMPPPDAVRLEEFINYFDYDYPKPEGKDPFSVNIELGDCPWAPNHRLVKIGLKGVEIDREDRPAGNFVFLLDVSGSMKAHNKLPWVKEAMKALLREMNEQDRVGIVTYASNSRIALPSTSCELKEQIEVAIDALSAGGSTHGSAGINDAYAMASRYFIKGGINRVILATDGDFNVGTTSRDALEELITQNAKSNIFLTALGFGMGNIKDATLETLADRGNGNYAYVDSMGEAQRVLSEQLSGTLITIAKDVKIQVEFNPYQVSGYRLLGYENRALATRDFNDDTKDAGEIGAGHTVTALYEIVPLGQWPEAGVDPLKYQPVPEPREPKMDYGKEMMTVKLRYKLPEGSKSNKIEIPYSAPEVAGKSPFYPSEDFQFAAAVAAFGMTLRDSQHKGSADLDMVFDLANGAKGDRRGRQDFVNLVLTTKALSQR